MKNNIKKAPVKFQEDLLYFQHFMLIFCLCPEAEIITTLNEIKLNSTCFFHFFSFSMNPIMRVKNSRICNTHFSANFHMT